MISIPDLRNVENHKRVVIFEKYKIPNWMFETFGRNNEPSPLLQDSSYDKTCLVILYVLTGTELTTGYSDDKRQKIAYLRNNKTWKTMYINPFLADLLIDNNIVGINSGNWDTGERHYDIGERHYDIYSRENKE